MHSTINLETMPDDGPRKTRRLRLAPAHFDGRQASLTVVHADVSDSRATTLGVRPVPLGREPGPDGFQVPGDRVSRHHATIRFIADADAYRIEDQGSTNGTWVDGKRVDKAFLAHGSIVRIGTTLLAFSYVDLPGTLRSVPLTPSPSWAATLALADRAARSEAAVLINGPTGSGKEVMAKRIHEASARSGPFVPLNCGGLSADLISSELFGHVAGAYTGAQGEREGLFVVADGGTLFLDEVAELPVALQPYLLRVLQEGVVRAIGSNTFRTVDVRIVAATHQDLAARVAEGRFREDLYARLAGLELNIDGLAGRREEILPLLRRFLPELDGPIEPDVAEALLLHGWPQNVREVQRVAHHARLFIDDTPSFDRNLLPPALRRRQARCEGQTPTRASLQALMDTHDGNVAQVARALGRHRQQVYRWLDRFAIERAR